MAFIIAGSCVTQGKSLGPPLSFPCDEGLGVDGFVAPLHTIGFRPLPRSPESVASSGILHGRRTSGWFQHQRWRTASQELSMGLNSPEDPLEERAAEVCVCSGLEVAGADGERWRALHVAVAGGVAAFPEFLDAPVAI